MSASETHVDILDYSPPNKRKGRLVNFITESGQLEFFMFGASSPKRVQKRLSGFQPLPPLFSLGFHYSRWEKTSARHVLNYNDKFEEHGFPVDVFWIDIGYSFENQYFMFHPLYFNQSDLASLRNAISVSDRRLVIITDPHIKVNA
jgi:alpha 1,3-glucosidase